MAEPEPEPEPQPEPEPEPEPEPQPEPEPEPEPEEHADDPLAGFLQPAPGGAQHGGRSTQAEVEVQLRAKEEAQLRELWIRVDESGSGELDNAAVREIVAEVAPRSKRREFRAAVDVLLEEADGDTIDFGEFIDWWRSNTGDEAAQRDYLPCDRATRKVFWVGGFSPFDCSGRCGCCSTPQLLDATDSIVDPASPVPVALRKAIDGATFGAVVLELNDTARRYTTPGMKRLVSWWLLLVAAALSWLLSLVCGSAGIRAEAASIGSSSSSWIGEERSSPATPSLGSHIDELCLQAFDSNGGELTAKGLEWMHVICTIVLGSGLFAAVAYNIWMHHWREPRIDATMRALCAEYTTRNSVTTWRFRSQVTSGWCCCGRCGCNGRYKYVTINIASTESNRVGRFLTVTAPKGAKQGDTILVKNPTVAKPVSHKSGCCCDECVGILRVAIPPGVAPGNEFQVQLPTVRLHKGTKATAMGAPTNRP